MSLISNELVSVQPLGGPTGIICCIDFQYGFTNPNTGQSCYVSQEKEPDKYLRYKNEWTNKFIHIDSN